MNSTLKKCFIDELFDHMCSRKKETQAWEEKWKKKIESVLYQPSKHYKLKGKGSLIYY